MARPKDPNLERAWRQRLRRQTSSGLSIAAFCAREGVSSASFHAWKRRLTARSLPARPEPPLFVPLHLDPHPHRSRSASSAVGSRSSYPTRSDSASTPRPSPNGWDASSPHSPASHARRPPHDHAPLGRPDLPLHPAHRHAQGLRWRFMMTSAVR